jgi:hypothetical protein
MIHTFVSEPMRLKHRTMTMRPTTVATSAANPFAMLLDPERLARSVEHSERLNRLHSRIYRPLDKPLIPRALADAADFDREIDAQTEADEAD